MKKKESLGIRHHFGLMPLSLELGHIAKEVLGKHGFSNVDLLAHWDDIIGFELAQGMKPDKITYPKDKRQGGTLHVRVAAGAFAIVIEHQKKIILDKINTFMGYDAISDIKIKQNLMQIKPVAKTLSPPKELTAQQEEILQSKIADIKDETLKEKLYQIGKSIFLK